MTVDEKLKLRAQNLGLDYIDRFRKIEFSQLQEGIYDYPEAAFNLLSDMEKCYASRAYYAAICLAYSAIEIYLVQVEKLKPNRKEGNVLKQAGLGKNYEWLIKIRNAIVHGNQHELIQYGGWDDKGLEFVLDGMCQKAFKLAHSLPFAMRKDRRELQN